MCKVYNPVGCLTAVKTHLLRHNIKEFKSLNEVISFQREFDRLRQEIISKSEAKILAEKDALISSNHLLTTSIPKTKEAVEKALHEEIETLKSEFVAVAFPNSEFLWKRIKNYFRRNALKRKIKHLEQELPFLVSQSVYKEEGQQRMNEKRLSYINNHFNDAVNESCSFELRALERKKNLIDEVNSMIYGAIGEQKVVKELEKLPDEYVLINDFSLTFSTPIYNRNENDYIRSIQIDHLLIAPSGLFLIETKNWSEKSLNSLELRSPVSQLKRTSFALFTILNSNTISLGLSSHHWGKKKISVKNLLVLTNQRPKEEFQFVKVLTLNQLLSYINYFPPIFTRSETENIANKLIHLSGSLDS